KGDILWRNDAGQVSIWQMDGVTRTASLAVAAPTGVGDSTDWAVVGTGDVNGDTRADVIWRNESSGTLGAWLMNAGTVAASGVLAEPGNWTGGDLANWQVADVNDYDSDGKADLLLRNPTSGENAIWKLDGLTAASATVLAGPAKGAEWAVIGAPLAPDV